MRFRTMIRVGYGSDPTPYQEPASWIGPYMWQWLYLLNGPLRDRGFTVRA